MDDRGLGGFFPVEANLGEEIVAGPALRFSCTERHEAESHLQTAEVDAETVAASWNHAPHRRCPQAVLLPFLRVQSSQEAQDSALPRSVAALTIKGSSM